MRLLSRKRVKWLVRACFSLVFAWNVLCALQFVVAPHAFAQAFQLTGVSGDVAVRGLGVAFLMWNVTYPLFIVNPARFKVLGLIILVQQLIGCVGEGAILQSLAGAELPFLASSIQRFLAFDVVGFVLMTASVFCLFYSLKR